MLSTCEDDGSWDLFKTSCTRRIKNYIHCNNQNADSVIKIVNFNFSRTDLKQSGFLSITSNYFT